MGGFDACTPGRSRATVIAALALVLAMAGQWGADAAPTAAAIRLVPSSGPPSSKDTVKGRGFGASEIVDISFDTTPVGSAATGPTGAFSTTVLIPISASPGDHSMTATGETSGQTGAVTFLVQTPWTRWHYDAASTGYNPYENVLNSTNVSSLDVKWTSATQAPGQSGAAVVNGIAYIGSNDGNLYAYDVATGATHWAYPAGAYIVSSPAVAYGMVFFGSGDSFQAIDAVTGATKWSYSNGRGFNTSPVVINGVVYAGSQNNNSDLTQVYAFDAGTGAVEWSYNVGGDTYGDLAVANGAVFVGSYNGDTRSGALTAVEAATGTLRWSFPATTIPSSPVVAKGIVYSSLNGALYALDAATGGVDWSVPFAGSAAVARGTLYLQSLDTLYALNAATGAKKWRYILPLPFLWSGGGPIVANGLVYGGLYANSGPGTVQGGVTAVQTSTGLEEWIYATPPSDFGGGATTPTVSDGVVYVTIYLSAYAFGLP